MKLKFVRISNENHHNVGWLLVSSNLVNTRTTQDQQFVGIRRFGSKSFIYILLLKFCFCGCGFSRKLSDISVPEIRLIAPSMERGLDASPPSHRASPIQVVQAVDQQVGRESSQDSYQQRDDDDTSEHESAFSLQTTSRFHLPSDYDLYC